MSSSLGRNNIAMAGRNNALATGQHTAGFMPMPVYSDSALTFHPNVINTTSASNTTTPTTLLDVTGGNDATNGTTGRYGLTQPQSSSTAYGHPLPPQHPPTLHPPLHSGAATANGLPYAFDSNTAVSVTQASTAAAASTAATGIGAGAAGYFAMPNSWNLQWPTNANGASSNVVQNNAAIAGLMGATSGWTATGTQRPRLTTTLWEDESTICYQVDAEAVCVARRQDNNMINGTKLLNVVGMTRGKRDGILKNEKQRIVVKVGAMHLKGVWIPFERAKILAEQHGILEKLYPLFSEDPTPHLLQHPPVASAAARLRNEGPMQALGTTGYDLALMGGINSRRRLPVTGQLAPSPSGYTNGMGGLDHLGMVDTSLLMEHQRSLAQPRGSMIAHPRKPSQSYGYGYGGGGEADTTTAVNHSSGVTSVIGAGGSPAAWSPITPSMDPRPYYPAEGIDPNQPTSPSAVIYNNGNKKRNSDHLLSMGHSLPQTGGNNSSMVDHSLYGVNYNAIAASSPLAMQVPSRTNYTGIGSKSPTSSQGPSSSSTTNTYPSIPLSPINSPATTSFESQPIERQYSEADDRPTRKRSRVGVQEQSTSNVDRNDVAPSNSLKSLTSSLQGSRPTETVYGGNGSGGSSGGDSSNTLPVPGLDASGQRSSGFVGNSGQSGDSRDTNDFPLNKYFPNGLNRAVSSEQGGAMTTGSHGRLPIEEATTAEASW